VHHHVRVGQAAVDLGRGLVLPNPVIAASGPFGYGVEVADLVDLPRLGGIVTRSTSLRPRPGHRGPRMAEVPAGMLLGMGPQNPGLDSVLERYAEVWARWPVPVILSLCADTSSELGEAARRLDGVPGIAGLELNLSCGGGRGGGVPGLDPDAAASYVAVARRSTELPVIAKLTAAASDVRAVARAVESAGADAIAAINTLPGFVPSADRRGPALASDYGGICGPALRPVALRVVWEVAQAVDLPVIGIGGVAAVDDVLDFRIRICEQVHLPDKCIFDLAGQFEPLVGGTRREIAQGADDLLTGSFGGMDGLHQQVVGVGLVLVSAGGLAHVHSHYDKRDLLRNQEALSWI